MRKRMTILLFILMLSSLCLSIVQADDMMDDQYEDSSEVSDDTERSDYELTMRLEGQTDYPEYVFLIFPEI